LFWRIARPAHRSPFRRVAQPVSVAERDVTASGTTLRVREYRPLSHAATILLNGGFVVESIDDARLINFAMALAEIGFLVMTPDYPAVRSLEFDPKTIDQIAGVIARLDQSATQGGRTPLAVLGLSYMGTLSLKAALRPELPYSPELVAVLGGYADFGDLMHDVFRDVYRTDGVKVHVDPYGRFLVLRSAIGYLDAPPAERERIREILLAMGRQLDSTGVERAVQALSPEGAACVEALRRFHPDRQTQQWRRIMEGSRELIEALSVTESPERLRSRLMILHSVYDHILPCSGSIALYRRFPTADLVLTTLFTHVNVRFSPRALWTQIRELRALFRMFGRIIALQG
ncbi:MAG TPA: hypothetical protein VFN94_06360, partial [Nitrospiria bacterium]|nr:hypothetical protein [Nitrospiria bacterium]